MCRVVVVFKMRYNLRRLIVNTPWLEERALASIFATTDGKRKLKVRIRTGISFECLRDEDAIN